MRILVAALFILIGTHAPAQPGGDTERTPFTEIRFTQDPPLIEVGGEWYVWHGIDGVAYGELADFAKGLAGERRWRERIGEDLVWVLTEFGQTPDESVTLAVAPEGGGAPIELADVPMTSENRRRVRDKLSKHLDELREQAEARAHLTLDQHSLDSNEVMDELLRVIHANHSYALYNRQPLTDSCFVDAVLLQAEYGISFGIHDHPSPKSWAECVLLAQRAVCRFGDGHAGIEDWQDVAPDGYLPVLLEQAEGGVVAYKPDRSGFVDPDHPYVSHIDGVPILDWVTAASVYITNGSPQLVRSRSLRLMRWINLVRDEMGREHDDHVVLTLTNWQGTDASARLAVADQRPIYGEWPRGETRVLESGIGYMRLASMQPSAELMMKARQERWDRDELSRRWLDAVAGEFDSLDACPAVIIDVRGNGGGGREPTLWLMKRIMAAGSEPVVVNAAIARLRPGMGAWTPEGYLDNRMLYPEEWSGWTPAELGAIAEFKRGFEPFCKPTKAGFSDWHYMVVSPDESSPANPRPVVVLIDEGCFSATDIFAAALGELPNVTLMGQATSGGSARSQSYDLEHLGISVRLGTMVSFQPTGELYDGVGVQPDVVVERAATDLIGQTDRVLEEAERILLKTAE